MTRPRRNHAKWQRRLVYPPRAVIDIGSNTVRLVIYEGTARAPEIVWNEKRAARLGRDLSETGRIPDEAAIDALDALARFKLLAADRGIDHIQTVATAAARDADNGADFLAKVAQLGLEPRLLTGAEEACASAHGAIGAFPGADGTVADLGGGSLELVRIGNGDCSHAVSLPLGTLRLPAHRREQGGLARQVATGIADSMLSDYPDSPMYMVGGTWRALAAFAMASKNYPLTDPHGFKLDVAVARQVATTLVDSDPLALAQVPGVSSMRSAYLPDAAALLLALLDVFQPSVLIFSSWGIREGLLYMDLAEQQRALDPLLTAVNAFAEPRDAPVTDAARVAGWTVDLANGKGARNERLRLSAAQLAAALQRVEPNLRVNHATEWALDKRWIDCDARARAMICAALFGSLGRTSAPSKLRELATDADIREALTWGLGFRLARRLGAGSRTALANSRLRLKKKNLVLYLDESRAALATEPLTRDLEAVAGWLDRKSKIKIGEYSFDEVEDDIDADE